MNKGRLTITRGIRLHISLPERELMMGPGNTLDFMQVPLELWLTLEGCAHPITGMVINVNEIKNTLIAQLRQHKVTVPHAPAVINWAWQSMPDKFPHCQLRHVGIQLHNNLYLSKDSEDENMMQLTARYELAASHRLRINDWDTQKNREVFGKCSNPAGHGHNYSLEVTLSGDPDPQSGQILDIEYLNRIVRQEVIEKFDHKNLNEDTEEFRILIPTVENMARVFWQRLQGRFSPATLTRIKVWETPYTFAEYSEI